ncbi:MAG: DNA/RNA non-specific endonuclease [Bacteroidales bacterium]|nr:DNA/RNA non-specific endonuclease [Bacteroidales bacterium]
MRRILPFFFLVAMVFCLTGCPSPEPEKQTITVSPSTLSFTDEGGTGTITVTSNGSWAVQVEGGWVNLSMYAGSGNGSVVVTAEANPGEARTGRLTFKTSDQVAVVELTQAAYEIRPLSIKQVRALYKGSDTKITDDIFMDGIVISDYRRSENGGLNNYSSARTIVISDGEAGIQLFTPSGDENKTLARGDKVRVSLKNQTITVFNHGAMEINGIPTKHIEKTGTATLTAQEITLDQLLTGNYESMYVAVKDVQLKAEDIGKTFEGTRIFEGKDGRDFDLFTSQYATFKGEKVPTGSGVLKGIAGKYNARIQLTLSAKTDCAGLTGARFSTGTHFSISFTEYPAWGDASSFNVVLTSDVEWTASSSDPDFTVSPSSGSEGGTITVSFGDNPSTTSVRTATITFKTTSSAVSTKELKLVVTQQPFEALKPSTVLPWLELPAIPEKDGMAYFSHDMTWNNATVRNYAFWLDLKNRVSLWVAYPLYKGLTTGSDRTNQWGFDPSVPRRYQAEVSSSFGVAGYDRGHQLPSKDRLFSEEANQTTFYYTNITPQNSDLNAGIWEKAEALVRNQISSSDTLYVVTGCVLATSAAPTIEYIKDNAGHDVAVPKAYYKVILKYKAGTANGGYSAIGLWFENKAYGSASLTKSYAKTVDEIETLTGIDFFHNLKDDYEKEAESKYNASAWGL